MRTKEVMIGGFYSPDFSQRFNNFVKNDLAGFRELPDDDKLNDVQASEAVLISTWYDRRDGVGCKRVFRIYYK